MDLPSDLIWLADFTGEHHILPCTAIKHWHPQHHNCYFSVVTTTDDTGKEVLQKFKRGRSFGYAIDHDNAILALLLWLRRGLISLDVIAACELKNCPCPHYSEWRDPDWRREHDIIERANALA